MKCSLGISNFLEAISSLSHSIVFLYFFALISEESFLISSCYSLELCIQMGISLLFSFAFRHWTTNALRGEDCTIIIRLEAQALVQMVCIAMPSRKGAPNFISLKELRQLRHKWRKGSLTDALHIFLASLKFIWLLVWNPQFQRFEPQKWVLLPTPHQPSALAPREDSPCPSPSALNSWPTICALLLSWCSAQNSVVFGIWHLWWG